MQRFEDGRRHTHSRGRLESVMGNFIGVSISFPIVPLNERYMAGTRP